MRSESLLSASDGDLYRNEEVQLSSAAHTNKDRSTRGARSMKGDEHDGGRWWSGAGPFHIVDGLVGGLNEAQETVPHVGTRCV